jgi:hypothetical protein
MSFRDIAKTYGPAVKGILSQPWIPILIQEAENEAAEDDEKETVEYTKETLSQLFQ